MFMPSKAPLEAMFRHKALGATGVAQVVGYAPRSVQEMFASVIAFASDVEVSTAHIQFAIPRSSRSRQAGEVSSDGYHGFFRSE